MSGNVGEWCWDLYVDSITSSTEAYPTGPFPSHLTTRVVRGGYWSSGIENAVYFCMTGKRDTKGSGGADPIRGFRLVWKEQPAFSVCRFLRGAPALCGGTEVEKFA